VASNPETVPATCSTFSNRHADRIVAFAAAKRSVSANINTLEEDNKDHTPDYEENS
jgi:hypothetical protein